MSETTENTAPRRGFSFSAALLMLKDGRRVARAGWNGKGMWLVLIDQWAYVAKSGGGSPMLAPFIAMKTADNKIVPWLASQTDMLAEDWELVDA